MALDKDTLISDISTSTYDALKVSLPASLNTVFVDLFSHVQNPPYPDAATAITDRALDWSTQIAEKLAAGISDAVSKAVGDAVDVYIKKAEVSVTVINSVVSTMPVPPVVPLLGSIGHKGVPNSTTTPGGIS